tara:strand:+ start:2087 stop:2314 length:228 start_codon:yes stop_codon:yes gene_type:complete
MATADSIRQRAYNSRPEQKRRRANRNKARQDMISRGLARKGDGKDVHHKDGNPMNNSRGNLALTSKKANRKKNKR